ncbi:hypothetical protein [Tepidibacter thalassicus]|uniref:Uncharacterized protein n=1 Tax=Tepidibacter thalassicus DSM 15285 TaxID=1123350 RepID=A0A1M5QLL7_9FIRM|nr:hypothetical protein [Tepidibacter thalassicus]SHH14866.1 hypothetical protein SAMN02744040_01023 [Tepidibacter thalassicus DSM 15285]
MSYNTIDLIDKVIELAHKRKEIYIQIKNNNSKNSAIKVIVNTLIKGIDKNINCYNNLKKQIKENEQLLEEINIIVYDKILFLVNQFKKRLVNPNVTDIKGLLDFSLDLEDQIYALFIDVQGRLVQKQEDTETNTYKIISDIIEEKHRYIKNLERFYKIK